MAGPHRGRRPDTDRVHGGEQGPFNPGRGRYFVFYDNDIKTATYFPTYCVPVLLLHTHSYLRSRRGKTFLRKLSNGIVLAQLRAILPPGDIWQGLETILIVTTRMGGRLASSGQSSGLLLNTLQSWGRPHNRGKSGPKCQQRGG